MLKIAELKAVAEAIDNEPITEANLESNTNASKEAWAAYNAERATAMDLKAEYEAMGDVDCVGAINAGDTFGAKHGDIRFISTEYWGCAIDSCQFARDFAA